MRVGTVGLIRFQTAYVSGSCRADAQRASDEPISPERGEKSAPARLFVTEPIGPVTIAGHTEMDAFMRRTVLQAVVERLSGHGPRAHEVWLPPLGAAPVLSTLLVDREPTSPLTVPIGIVDRPFVQCRTPLVVDLSGAAGNVAIVGAPQSGKSTALRTLITALAATHDPGQVQFYYLAFGGGALSPVSGLPHVGAVAGRAEPDLARRIITELESVVQSRE